jgi:hypothetical protein
MISANCGDKVSDFRNYKFDRPTIVLAESVIFCPSDVIMDGAAFVNYLADIPSPMLALVIPLEMRIGYRYAQELLGLELLEWTRWSGPALEQLPVLALSWLSFEKIQRLRHAQLLAQNATTFLRLPAPPMFLEKFVETVREGKLLQEGHGWEEIRRGISTDAALTHHDLANDYYGAYRLWCGYKALLPRAQRMAEQPNEIAIEVTRIENTEFSWSEKLNSKLKQPHVRRFQALAEEDEFPAYQELNDEENLDGARLVESHLLNGLEPLTRILLIDDQFGRGWGEVLLNIFFKESKFTYRTSHEAVFSQTGKDVHGKTCNQRWARMVCVDSAERARYWLNYWDELPLSSSEPRDIRPAMWAQEWADSLGIDSDGVLEVPDILGHAAKGSVDDSSARPKDVSTIVLLDLRLEPHHQPRIFNVNNLGSIKLRTEIKMRRPTMPIIMFTASRHAITATQIMRNSSDADGWYVKEAPDVLPDDENSARGVLYLLERLHMFSQLHQWYRESLEWDADRKLEYAHFHNSQFRDEVLEFLDQDATRLFRAVRAESTGWDKGGYPTYLGFLQEHAPVRKFEIETTLIGRRVALGALLLTATVEAGELRWNAQEFNRVLPGSPQSRVVKALYDKLNFNRVLWLRTREIHTQLLSEEVNWLRRIDWPEERRIAIEQFLTRAAAEVERVRSIVP